jgi:superfamily I DNA and/or RNA helicase
MSKANPHEAKFLSSLCRYFVQQGYAPSRITILTTYTGQMFLIKNEIRNLPTCRGVRVTVVDNFQGEENDVRNKKQNEQFKIIV